MKKITEYIQKKHITNRNKIRVPKIKNLSSNNYLGDYVVSGDQYIDAVQEYVAYKDTYRNGRIHIAHLSDALLNIFMNGYDSEDIKPDTIVYSSTSLLDVIKWVLREHCHIQNLDTVIKQANDEYDLEALLDKKRLNICDNTGWLANVLYNCRTKADEKNAEEDEGKPFEVTGKNDLYDDVINKIKEFSEIKV